MSTMRLNTIIFGVILLITENLCKESEYDEYRHDDMSNLTSEEEDDQELLSNLMRPREFTAGTLLGLLVAAMVVVIGSFLVLWRVCCEVEMVVTREVMEPLTSVSQVVDNPRETSKKPSRRLLGHGCRSSFLQIA